MTDPSVLDTDIRDHLVAENAYFKAVTAPTVALKDDIFAEMKGRMAPTDMEVPSPDGVFAYFHLYREGDQFGVYKRAKLIDRETLALGEEEVCFFIVEIFSLLAASHHTMHSKQLAGKFQYDMVDIQ